MANELSDRGHHVLAAVKPRTVPGGSSGLGSTSVPRRRAPCPGRRAIASVRRGGRVRDAAVVVVGGPTRLGQDPLRTGAVRQVGRGAAGTAGVLASGARPAGRRRCARGARRDSQAGGTGAGGGERGRNAGLLLV